MAEKDNRTERATPRKREREREEGRVAISREVVAMAVLLMAATVLVIDPASSRENMLDSARRLLGSLDQIAVGNAGRWVQPLGLAAAALVFPVALAALVGALVAGFSQTGGLFSFKKMKVNFGVLNPLPKLRQMFASQQALTSVLVSLGKVLAVGLVVTRFFMAELPRLQTLGSLAVLEVLSYLGSVTLRVAAQATILLVLFAIIDLVLVHHRYEEGIKMSKQDIKDEYKDMEGDPDVKRRQRSRMREQGRRMMAEVPKAAVVLVNPTHYAVALSYDAAAMGAPRVVAKGRDEVAARIREVAREHRVPVLRNPPLTRKLFKECELGAEVPPAYYGAVAEVLALIYRLRGGLIGASA